MSTYIIIARHLGVVSGEKIYHYNKLRYMLSLGWRVIFLSGKEEKTPVDNEKNYSHFVFPALTYTPACYSRREIQKTLDAVVRAVGSFDSERCIIESDAVNRAIWGELIAKRLGAKHLIFLLQENHPYDSEIRAFLRFKYERHELAGILPQSINQMLGDESVERRDDTRIAACCQNSVEHCEDQISPRLPAGAALTFGYIGRLDKRCISAVLQGFKEYAAARPDESFNCVLIGGATNQKFRKKIVEQMKECRNIHLLITGFLYPIPASLLRRIDVFVSTAASARISYRFHRPTVVVHPITGEPSGVLGLDDLDGKNMFDTRKDITVAECIERALSNAEQIDYIYNEYEDYDERIKTEFARQLAIADVVTQKEYYEESKLMRMKSVFIQGQTLHWLIGHTLGAAGLNSLVEKFKVLRKGGRRR